MIEKGRTTRRLGEILLQRGIVTEDQIAEALRPGKGITYFSKFGEVLIHLGYATPDQIQAALREQAKS